MRNSNAQRLRRRLLAAALASQTFALCARPARAALPDFLKSLFMRSVFDVVVIGGGGAGLAAAASAAESGASVVLLEKLSAVGGNTLRSAGIFNAVDPARQRALGIKDSVAWHARQTLESGRGLNDPTVVERFAQEAPQTLVWLESLGLHFMPKIVATWGSQWPRGHKPAMPRGTGYIRALSGRLLSLGGEIRTGAACERLIKSDGGRIAGVSYVQDGKVHDVCARRGVILCAGGYAASKPLLQRYAPQLAGMPTDNSPGSTGEVMLAAEAAGAALANLSCVQTVPGSPPGRDFQVRLDLDSGRFILVDRAGHRFVDEDAARDVLSAAILSRKNDGVFSVTDNAAVESFDLLSRKSVYRGLQTGDALRAGTLDTLAQEAGLSAEGLRASIAAFNEEARAGRGKCGRIRCRPIESPPFWAAPIVLNVHSTMGGLRIDPSARVLDVRGQPMPGLFAAGEIVTSVHGANRIGGNGIAAAMTFGRIAGLAAAVEKTAA